MFSSDKAAPSELIRAKDASSLDVWALPSFDPHVEAPEPEPVEEPDPVRQHSHEFLGFQRTLPDIHPMD